MKNKYYDISVYVVTMLIFICSRVLGGFIAPYFDFAGYGAMRPFFVELFTSIIWAVGIVIMYIVFMKKYKYNIFGGKETRGNELPIKRVLFIGIIVSVCIIIISAGIGFQVKPFYDLGEKFNGYDLFNNLGIFLRNAVKCFLIVILAKASQDLVEFLLKKDRVVFPWCGIVLMLTMGVYDVIMGMNNLAIIYMLLYVVYGWLYILVEKNAIKSYLLITFIFLF